MLLIVHGSKLEVHINVYIHCNFENLSTINYYHQKAPIESKKCSTCSICRLLYHRTSGIVEQHICSDKASIQFQQDIGGFNSKLMANADAFSVSIFNIVSTSYHKCYRFLCCACRSSTTIERLTAFVAFVTTCIGLSIAISIAKVGCLAWFI